MAHLRILLLTQQDRRTLWVAVVITGRVQEAGEAFENALVEAVVLDSLFCPACLHL